MLKKIVKYGNSSALILDKALLELLDIAEGSIVKIRTDGCSLIITPQQKVELESISPTLTIEDSVECAVKGLLAQSFGGDINKAAGFQKEMKEMCLRHAEFSQQKKDEPEQQAIVLKHLNQELEVLADKYPTDNQDWSSFNIEAASAEFAEIHRKYQHLHEPVATLMESPDYIHEMALLAEKYQTTSGTAHSKEYLEEYAQCIARYIPEYIDYQDALKKVGEKHTVR